MNKPYYAWEGPRAIKFKITKLVWPRYAHQSKNSWKVLDIAVIEGEDASSPLDYLYVKATGEIEDYQPDPSIIYRATAKWTFNKKYSAWQIEFSDAVAERKLDKTAIIKSLMELPQIGAKRANDLYDLYGADTFGRIKDLGPVAFVGIGVGRDVAEEVYKIFCDKEEAFAIRMKLMELGFNGSQIKDLVNFYADGKYDAELLASRIKENPYSCIAIDGITFPKADRLGKEYNIEPNDPRRIAAGMYYVLHTMQDKDHGSSQSSQGHCYTPRRRAISTTVEKVFPGMDLEADWPGYRDSEAWQELLVEDDQRNIWPRILYSNEASITTTIEYMLNSWPIKSREYLDKSWEDFYKQNKDIVDALSEEQREAVRNIPHNPFSLFTGSAGTGKTSTLRVLVQYLNYLCIPVILMSPTGKAAQRLSESTGMVATTIHSAAKTDGSGRGNTEIISDSPSFIIVDEAGMITTPLMSDLLSAVPPGSQVVLVGDPYQLMPVGPGKVFDDMLKAGTIPTFRLTKVFRQNEGSGLLEVAYAAKNQQMPNIEGYDDVILVDIKDKDQVQDWIVEFYENLVANAEEGTTLHPDNFRTITLTNNKEAGVKPLNKALQPILNPNGVEIYKHGGYSFREGDLCVWKKNLPEGKLVNGQDIELFEVVPEGDTTKIVYETYDVSLRQTVTEELDADFNAVLGYAVTCHTFQGSESPAIVVALTEPFTSNRWLYTATTRAKQFLVVVGNLDLFVKSKQSDDKRRTRLTDRLQEMTIHEKV